MAFNIRIVEGAAEKIRSMPLRVQLEIPARLHQLAENPMNSRRSRPPAEVPGYQISEFTVRDDDHEYRVKFYFRHADTADENTIIIMRLGLVTYRL